MLGPKQQAWVDALRANPEQQLRGSLIHTERYVNGIGYCCLGKLCAMDMANAPEGTYKEYGIGILGLSYYGMDESTYGLARYLVKEYGFRSNLGALAIPFYNDGSTHHKKWFPDIKQGEGFYPCLAALNDNGATWPQIANYIEAHPGNVFTKFV